MKSGRKLIEISNGYYLKEGEFLYQKVQKKKFRAAGENLTHDPPSFSSDALTN